jgi:hypothetical protein
MPKKQADALQARLQEPMPASEQELVQKLDGKHDQQQWEWTTTQRKHKIVAHAGAVLLSRVPSERGFFMPDVNARQ